MIDSQIDSVINQAIEQAVDKSFKSVWWTQVGILILSVICSALIAYVVAYVKKKGENYATKEDFEELLRQIKATTRATEEIKTEISSGAWVNQQRWELRKNIYLILLEKLNESKYALGEVMEAEGGIFEGDEAEREKYIDERLEKIKRVSEDIRKSVELSGVLFLSDNALKVLRDYENAEENRLKALSEMPDLYGDVSAEATSWSCYLEGQSSAAIVAYNEIVKVAKEDLQIQK